MNSLRSKIYVGFAIIVSLLVMIGIIGYSGVSRLYDLSSEMRRISDINAVVLTIDRDAQELQMRVGRYVDAGNDSLRDEIVELNDRLVEAINDRAEGETDLELQSLFARMSEHLPEYRLHFDSVIEERQVRYDLVQRQLPQQSEMVAMHLQMMSAERKDHQPDNDDEVAVLRCESLFSQAEKLLLRYYVDPDSRFVNEALNDLDAAIASLQEVESQPEDYGVRANAIAALREYKRIGVRAVQATRGYLYLVNVVMAGEASEVTYYSDKLRQVSAERRRSISAEIASTVTSVRQMTGFGIALAVILAVLIAGRLAVLILRPITRLTSTFEHLAAGETVVEIPETHRRDEIGQMAMAAGVFSNRNLEQKQLLMKSEQLSAELAKKAEELEASNSELDSFAYVASHDLKSPLRGIRQLASWIDEDSGHLLPECSVKHFRAMQSRVRRMERLLDDLLNFSRVGQTDGMPENVDLAETFRGIVEMTDNPNGISIRVDDALPTIHTERIPLEHVLMNLVGNAIKHNDKKELGVVELTCQQQVDGFLFKVCDNGPGIDPLHHERVFQMYQRVGDADVDGSGMGLAIVKKQVQRLGGTIRVDSNDGPGVTFSMMWPATLAH